MKNINLFRVLSTTEEEIKINPISEKNGVFFDTDENSITIKTDNSDSNVTQVLSFVNPGNVIYAGITKSEGSYQFKSVEHRGGFSLVELDSELVPYIIKQNRDVIESNNDSVNSDLGVIPLSLLTGSESDDFCGELVIQYSSGQQVITWNEFRCGTGSEGIYGSFETSDGTPEEVFIGNPTGEDYWYAFLFPEYKTEVAKLIRAQFGYLYDDHFLPNQAWNSTQLINEDKLPGEPHKSPKEMFSEEFSVHSSALPKRFGRNTVELLAELVYVGTQFEIIPSSYELHKTLDLDQPFLHSPQEIRNATTSIMTIYRFYTNLLIGIYDNFDTSPETDPQSLIENGTLPHPELLYRARQKFVSQMYELEAYFKKMRQVPVEEYVVEQFKGFSPDEKQTLREKYDIEGLPLMIRHILYDIEEQLDEITDVLEVTDYIASVESTESGFKYEILAEERAYQFIQQHQNSVTNLLTPAELGGDGSDVFMLTLGRLGHRHNWLDISPLGPKFSQMAEEMR
jgi:hypothetical protein